MSEDADRCGMPTGIPGGCPLPGDHQGGCQPAPKPAGLRNANRCTPCLNSHHDRCTGSAGNVGCGCIHNAPVPVPVLDPVKVRQHLTDLEREREVAQHLVTYLDDALDGAERTLTSIDRRLADLRAHPAVVAALADPAAGQ